tara:strand:+ start:522 stop:767 length:246 start_codon:yes stop_codon:yes gene_type:complete
MLSDYDDDFQLSDDSDDDFENSVANKAVVRMNFTINDYLFSTHIILVLFSSLPFFAEDEGPSEESFYCSEIKICSHEEEAS